MTFLETLKTETDRVIFVDVRGDFAHPQLF